MRTELWNGRPIRFVEREGEWWAVADDVCKALEHSNSRMALKMLDDDEKGVSKVYTPGGAQKANIVSESGLYTLIVRSNAPEAKAFRKWVISLLKTLREALGYEQYQAMSFARSVRNHHLDMDRLKEALRPSDKVPYVKAHSVANKCMANIVGEAKAIGKDELKARYPEMLPLRDEVLSATAELMALNDRYGLGVSVSKAIYGRFGAGRARAC